MQKVKHIATIKSSASNVHEASKANEGLETAAALLLANGPLRQESHSSTQEEQKQAVKQSGSSSSSAQGGVNSAPSKSLSAPNAFLSKPLGPIADASAKGGLPPKPIPLGSNAVMVVDGKIVPIGWRPAGDSILPLLPVKTSAPSAPNQRKQDSNTPLSGASDAANELLVSLETNRNPPLKTMQSSSIAIEGMGASPGSKTANADKSSNSLLESLMSWRSSRMQSAGDGKQKLSANSFLPESILLAVAQKPPTSIVELQIIPGMTPARIQKLGQEILDLVRQHLHSQALQRMKRKEASAPVVALGRASVTTSSNTSAAAADGLALTASLAPPLIQDKASEGGDDDSSSSAMQLLMDMSRKDQAAAVAAGGVSTDDEPMAMAIVDAQVEPLLHVAAPNAGVVVKKRRQRRKAHVAEVDQEESEDEEEPPKKKGKKDSLAPPLNPPYPGGPAFLNRVSDAALKQYSSEEDRWILRQVAAGMPEGEVAAILRRSRNAIVRRVRLLIARATSAGNAAAANNQTVQKAAVAVAPPLAPAPAPSLASAPPEAPRAAEVVLLAAPASLASNPSEEAAAVRAILSARAAAALARSTTSLPQHLRDPLIQYLLGDAREARAGDSNPAGGTATNPTKSS